MALYELYTGPIPALYELYSAPIPPIADCGGICRVLNTVAHAFPDVEDSWGGQDQDQSPGSAVACPRLSLLYRFLLCVEHGGICVFSAPLPRLYGPYTAPIPPLYGPYTAPIRPLYRPPYGAYTAPLSPLYRSYMAPIPPLYRPYMAPILPLYRPYIAPMHYFVHSPVQRARIRSLEPMSIPPRGALS